LLSRLLFSGFAFASFTCVLGVFRWFFLLPLHSNSCPQLQVSFLL